MKINKLLRSCLRVFFVGVFILSLGTPSPVRAAPGADLHVNKVLNGASTFTAGEQGRTYTITVSNLGDDPTNGSLVTVTDTLPTGLSATAIGGTGWSCTLGTLTCTRSDVLLGEGASYPDITLTVNVAISTSTPLTNSVTVSGGGENDPEGNQDTVETVVTQKPDLIIDDYEFVYLGTELPMGTDPAPNEPFGIKIIVKNQGGAGTSGVFYRSVFVNRNPMNPALFTITSPDGCLYNIAEGENDTGDYFKDSFFGGIGAGETDTGTVVEIPSGLPAGNYQIFLYADPTCIVDDESTENNNSYGPIPVTVGTACTIPTGNPPVFADVPASHWAVDYIEAMYYCGYTSGCSTSPLNYCPQTVMSRVESAVFMLRGNFGSTYTPPTTLGSFKDNWAYGPWAEKWAQGLYNAGLTAGCNANPLLFCPWNQTPRVQLAVFAVRLKYGNAFVPPPATGTVFADFTDVNHFGTKWAELAYADGLIPACGTSGGKPLFCPNSLVDRALAAYSVAKAKNLVP